MLQRVMIASAIISGPSCAGRRATTALDVTIQKQILELLKKAESGNTAWRFCSSAQLHVCAEAVTRGGCDAGGKHGGDRPGEDIFQYPRK
jgi:ABC-type dipeptide/oligopeptide/nickel transport system ATPase component